MQSYAGSIVGTLYRNNDFLIVRFLTTEGAQMVALGKIPEAGPDEIVELQGSWSNHVTHGPQFNVDLAVKRLPTTLDAIERFLSYNVAGCGPKTAAKIVAHFGPDLRRILDESPHELMGVPGMRSGLAQEIQHTWQTDVTNRKVGLFAAEIGLGPRWARKLIERFGPMAPEIITANPYRLTEIEGLGFKRTDELALRLGWKRESVERAAAVLIYVLREASLEGHVYLTKADLLERASVSCGSPRAAAEKALTDLIARKRLVDQTGTHASGSVVSYLYLPKLYRAECAVAKGVATRIAGNHVYLFDPVIDAMIRTVETRMNVELTVKQREAVQAAFKQPISILTGGPGTGKTLTVKVIVACARELGWTMQLMSPTGRAAKHMSNVSGETASTVHRALEYGPDESGHMEFRRNADNPLEAELILMDESSMCDIELAAAIMDALPRNCHFVFIGDNNQLPSVGPGRVLGDLIVSGRVHVTQLDIVHRQAQTSQIIVNAHRILSDKMPVFPPRDPSGRQRYDCHLYEPPQNVSGPVAKADWVRKTVVELVADRIPKKLHVDPMNDIQVLCPMKKGSVGVAAFNQALQEALNPKQPDPGRDTPYEIEMYGNKFRVGDRVQCTRNQYAIETFNGDIGRILEIDAAEKRLKIDFYDQVVFMPFDMCDELTLAYAQTVHKSQGSEYKIVIAVFMDQHHVMLQRNLLFTAFTRAKDLLIVAGSQSAIRKAVENTTVGERNTLLSARIRAGAAVTP